MVRTAAMMQPYLFPYLGYFQLIAASDVFVLLDDVQYIKRSWINRNQVLVNGQAKLITFPLRKGSQTDLINQRQLCDDLEQETLLKMLERCYAKAPHRAEVMALLQEILANPERNLALFTENSIRRICCYLEIDTPMFRGSELADTRHMDKQERIIYLARKLDCNRYLNPIGGLELYCAALFRDHGLQLNFLRMDDLTYPQLKHPFVPYLSIIDVLMFNDRPTVQGMLKRFSVLEGREQTQAIS